MDPVSALLMAMLIAGYFTRNITQDVVYAIRGADPPSYRRQRERWKQRQAKGDGPGRKFLANAWADAVASAEERRARMVAKAAAKRRAKWAEQDRAEAEDEAYAINERLIPDAPDDLDGPTLNTGAAEQDEVLWACRKCGREMRNSGPDGYPRDERVCRHCRTGDPLPDRRPCHFCRRTLPAGELWATRSAEGATVDACKPCWEDHNRAAREPRREASEPSEPSEPSGPGPEGAKVIRFSDWQRPAANGTAEKENGMSAEVTGLRSGIAYVKKGTAAATQAAAQTEVVIAALRNGGVTGPAISHLTAAVEGHQINAGHYATADTALTRQLQVTEQYEVTPDAGTKEFVTND